MFRSERFNLKDAVYLTVGIVVCALLLIVLVQGARNRALMKQLQHDVNEQRLQMDRAAEEREKELRLAQQQAEQFFSAAASTLDARRDVSSNNEFASACRCVNSQGKPQRWQTAPDDELPEDFAAGGTLRLVWGAEPSTLMPMVGRDIYAGIVHGEVFEKLVWRDLDPPFDYISGLAKSWQITNDRKLITFQLYENARWSDDEPVTAADVVFTYNLVMNEQFAAPIERAILRDSVERCVATGPSEVKFELNKPHSDAIGLVGERLWILPKHIYEQYTIEQLNSMDDLCVGSGPWRIERWTRGSELVFARNENYWGPKPAIERMEVRFISNDRQELDLFLSGQVDVIGPTNEQWIEYARSAAVTDVGRAMTYETPLRGYTWIGCNLRLPMFQDVSTRRALAMLIDRQHLIDTLLGGLGRIVTGPFHPLTQQCDQTIEPVRFDVNEARRLLSEAGWSDSNNDGVRDKDLNGDGHREPLAFTFLIPSNESDRLVQRYVKSQFALAGIDVALDELPWSVFQQRVLASDYEMIMQRSAGDVEVDAHEYWHSSQIDGGRNYVGFQSQLADNLIEQAQTTINVEERMELWRQLHRHLHEQQAQLFLWTTPRVLFVNHRVQGVQPRALRLYTSEWYITGEGDG